MRLLIGILLFNMTLFGISCNTETPDFYIHKQHDITIPPGLSTIETHFFIIPNINNTFSDELESRALDPEMIKSVNAGKGSFTPVFTEFNYGLIDKVSIWLVSVEDPSYRKEIYYRDQVPLNLSNELRLLSGISNLKDFLLSEKKYNLEIQLNFRNFVPTELENRFTYSFAIFTE